MPRLDARGAPLAVVATVVLAIDVFESDDRASALLRRLLLDQVVNDALDTFDLDELLNRLVAVATSVLAGSGPRRRRSPATTSWTRKPAASS